MQSSVVMSHDPQGIRRLTQGYATLRGLEGLPFLLYFLVKHSAALVGVSLSPAARLPLVIASITASFAIHRYYDRRFGVVTTPLRWGGGTLVLALIAFVALETASAYLELPAQLGFLAIAVVIAVFALRDFELKGHRLFAAIPFVVIAFSERSIFEALDPSVPKPPGFYAAAVAFDATWIMVALWDHRMLVKAFERARLASTG
jgi:hypothetical protein